ncbi:hypothetical protein TNCV_2483471 [Trichonephila clavipes]|uniref:Uncharacterized protein n=1 Tax=Trichonephila clavipes TaxID=2585209 RepID=A0A8X6VZR0_TRICX|nr:hypothetical protein TNCV_2483471 [Trichonephila clavipes]
MVFRNGMSTVLVPMSNGTSLVAQTHPIMAIGQPLRLPLHPNFEGEHPRGGWEPPLSLRLPPILREDLRLDGYLEYPLPQRHYTRTCTMSSPGFEPSPNDTAISIANYYTGVSAADKLDPRPDAVALYSGCTPVPQTFQTYAQVSKTSTAAATTQTDDTITKIVCPALKLLQPLRSVPKPNTFSLVPAVFKSSTSTQAQLLPSTSSVIVTSSLNSQPPAPSTANNLSTSAASSSSTISISTPLPARPVQNTTTTSNTILSTSQDAKQSSKPRIKNVLLKHIYQYKTKNRN